MTGLPAWCATPEGRALVEQIIAEQPDYFIRSGAWIEGGGVRHYTGKAVGKLRALYNHRRDRLMREADAVCVAGTPWEEAARYFNELLRSEQPDALVERVLREKAVPYTRMSIDLRDDGGRIAA
jgi:hypothetical protein